MISIIIFLISLLLIVMYAISTRSDAVKKEPSPYRGDPDREVFNPKWITKLIVMTVIALLIALFQPYALTRVDAGSTGIKVKLSGDDRGISNYEYKSGWVVYNDWSETLHEFSTHQEHIEYDTIEVITKGGFAAKITPSFNYSVIPGAVGDMFLNLRLSLNEIEQGWLKNAIISSVNDVANKWTIDDIFNEREKFEASIIAECNKRVSKWFVVSQLRSNIRPPESLQIAIIQKTKLIQEAQGEAQKALVADAQAQVKIANARGDSAQVVIRAQGDAQAVIITADAEAKAMQKKQLQLTLLYNDYIRATTWDGHYPTTMLGSGSNTLLQLK